MKRTIIYLVIVMFSSICYGQNTDIDIKYIHSEGGKQWKRVVRVDDEDAPIYLQDDVLTFYSNGTFLYNHAATMPPNLGNAKTKTWSYNKETNVITWEFYLSNGTVKKYTGEITYLDEQKVVMNFSEDGKDTHIAVFTSY